MLNNNRSLLSILKNLYSQLSQLSLSITQFRLNTYRRESKPQSNITSVLHQQIEDLSSRAAVEKNNNEQEVQANEEDREEMSRNNGAKVENITGVESEFAKHIKQRRPPLITQPQMGENLKSSLWKHINAAIRYAKNGDVETAKIHTDIAGSALEEAGHYMSQDDYSELILQIESYFSEHS